MSKETELKVTEEMISKAIREIAIEFNQSIDKARQEVLDIAVEGLRQIMAIHFNQLIVEELASPSEVIEHERYISKMMYDEAKNVLAYLDKLK